MLNVEAGERRLAELGPPQRTKQVNRRGRTLTITSTLLAQGSCGISHPYGDERTLREYMRRGEPTKLRRRLEVMPSRSMRFISTDVFMEPFDSAGAFSTRCCPRPGSTGTSRCCISS